MESNQICNCLWACARLRVQPPAVWLRTFFDASYRQLPYFKPGDLSQVGSGALGGVGVRGVGGGRGVTHSIGWR